VRISDDKRDLLRKARAEEEKQHREFMERNELHPDIDPPHLPGSFEGI
jgi:hypothetical protein